VHASRVEEGGARAEEDDRGLEMVVEVDHEVEDDDVVHKVVGVALVDDGDDDDVVVAVGEDKIQDVVVADHICAVVAVVVVDVGLVVEVDVDVYEKAFFFFF
jgi:hypothetical protein